MKLEDVASLPPALEVPEAAELLGLSRAKGYEEARRFLDSGGIEGLPAVRFGRRIVVPTVRVLALLGLDHLAATNGQDPEGSQRDSRSILVSDEEDGVS